MEETKQYLRYKKQFKMECIFKVAASVAALLTLVFLLFIPCFRISLAETAEEAEFMLALGLTPYHDFSLFDEIVQSFQSIGGVGGNNPYAMVSTMFSVYQILAMLSIIVAIVLFAVDCVKSGMGIMNLENYSLLAYDEIKSRAGVKDKKKKWLSPARFFMIGVVLEIIYIVMNRFIPTAAGEGSEGGSYMMQMTGVSGTIAVVIIFAIIAAGLLVYSKMLKSKIKTAILKEDYNLTEKESAA